MPLLQLTDECVVISLQPYTSVEPVYFYSITSQLFLHIFHQVVLAYGERSVLLPIHQIVVRYA